MREGGAPGPTTQHWRSWEVRSVLGQGAWGEKDIRPHLLRPSLSLGMGVPSTGPGDV